MEQLLIFIQRLFPTVLRMSLYASWLVGAVLLLRLLLRKAPKWTHCLLWALVALRLLCPVVPESAVSLAPRLGGNPVRETETISNAVDALLPEIQFETPRDRAINRAAAEAGQNVRVSNSAAPKEYLPLVWAAGMGAMLVYALVSWLRLRRRVRESVRLRENVWLSDQIGTPFILGVFRPKIYLPANIGESNIAPVLAHERAHLRRRDHWWKPLGFALLAVYWFNPVLWLAYVLLCRDIELACDEKAVRELDPEGRKFYAEALLACSTPRPSLTACPLAFGETDVKQRIQTVVKYKKPAFWVVLASVAVCAVVALCFLTNPKEQTTETASAQAPEPIDFSWLDPPALTLAGREPVTAYAAAFDWTVANGGRSSDSLHPLLLSPGAELPVLRRELYDVYSRSKPGQVFLVFDREPDEVRVYRWSDEYWQTGKTRAEAVALYPNQDGFDLAPGGYVYEVVADWTESPEGYGTVCYWFYGVLGASERDGAEELPYGNTLVWVPTEPLEYGISDEMLRAEVLPDFASMSLEALGAYYLHTDGAGAEGAAYYLYQWFMDYPDSVLIYLERIQGRAVENPSAPENTAERQIIRAISAEARYGNDSEAYEALLRQCRAVYPVGSYARLIELLWQR